MAADGAYKLSVAQALKEFGADQKNGLSDAEVAKRQEEYGPNELPSPEPTPFWTLVLKQFEDLLVLILLGAAITSFVLALFEDEKERLTAFVEPAVILLILIANAAVGVIQETNAEKSIEALRKSEARDTNVLRNGRVVTMHAKNLVPGDIIHIDVGDKVPADARLIEIATATLSCDEAMLTGESVASSKTVAAIKKNDAVNAEKRNLVFSGTLCVRGKASAVVIATGGNTAMGEIASGLQEKDDEEKTPLQEKLDEFGEQLSKIILIICIVVWLININHFTDEDHGGVFKGAIYYFKIAVALAVAAIPEGLPAVVTTCLALGTMRMAKKNAIVRTLPSVETLGCTTVICSDKTGTLTTNKMSVQSVAIFDSSEPDCTRTFKVAGDSWAPYGAVTDEKDEELQLPAAEVPSLADVSKICALCNEAGLAFLEDEKTYTKTGAPTEAALKVLAEKLGVHEPERLTSIFRDKDPHVRVSAVSNYWNDLYQRRHLLEFDRNRKSMSVLVTEKSSGRSMLYCKGAPESVLNRCNYAQEADGKPIPLSKSTRKRIMEKNDEMAAQGLRILAVAYALDPSEDHDWKDMDHFADIESNMVFVGLVGMLDPPRKEVSHSIHLCKTAGIRVIVITGDNQVTAESICRRIGVFSEDEELRKSNKSFTGAQFAALSEEQQNSAIRSASLFSRVEPRHKSLIVGLLKKQGEITAMTGDGVNDAPALKAAHIGIAMGSGTDVAREACDMVLQDDNFATIVMAVEEGRAIYANTKQFIRYLISSNIGEVACIFMTAAIGIPEALIPVQLLWVNLVTDGLPATALGFNPADSDIMQRPPRDRDERIINGWMFFRYMAIGIYVGFATVAGFIYWYLYADAGPHITYAQLTNFHSCGAKGGAELFADGWTTSAAGCDMFKHTEHPSTVALSILVTIEMFNALNALSENQSLLSVPPWSNIWVVLAILLSFALHFGIVYVPFCNDIFHVAPLNREEWEIVFGFSFPVFLLDEVLKFITRRIQASQASSKKDQ